MTSGIHDTGEVTRTPGTETAVLAGGSKPSDILGVALDRRLRFTKHPRALPKAPAHATSAIDHATCRSLPPTALINSFTIPQSKNSEKFYSSHYQPHPSFRGLTIDIEFPARPIP